MYRNTTTGDEPNYTHHIVRLETRTLASLHTGERDKDWAPQTRSPGSRTPVSFLSKTVDANDRILSISYITEDRTPREREDGFNSSVTPVTTTTPTHFSPVFFLPLPSSREPKVRMYYTIPVGSPDTEGSSVVKRTKTLVRRTKADIRRGMSPGLTPVEDRTNGLSSIPFFPLT